ncbi:MAG: dethiobiotin synthase [Gammaproteobacteria bacterium]|nr:dethiobiotin synthase [Gammaproteobacteria bacterium]
MNCFITGTDTEIGKTTVTAALLFGLQQRGCPAVGMKPVAAGAVMKNGVATNADVDQLRRLAPSYIPSKLINPYLFEAPTAPQIAAEREARTIEWPVIAAAFADLTRLSSCVVVEGIGGWDVPLSTVLSSRDIPRRLALPVILVSGIRLGAINHTLLTARAIENDGCQLLGWVANVVDPHYPFLIETIATLRATLPAPCLAEIPWLTAPTPEAVANWLVEAIHVIDDRPPAP